MINKEDKKVQKYINELSDFCKKADMKTQKQIYEWLLAELMEAYKGKVLKWTLEWIAKDFTESICLKLNIPQTGIR